MKRRNGFVGIALLGTLIVLMAVDVADAQRLRRRNRGTDTGYYGNQPPVTDSMVPPGQDPSRMSYYPTNGAANIQLRLPNPDAEVRFDGQATQQKGTTRLYTTPPLDGTYTYQVTAAWQMNGQKVEQNRTVTVRPGTTVMIDFMTAPRSGIQ
jgi:uncharacterized protein (TIGR03000 family)